MGSFHYERNLSAEWGWCHGSSEHYTASLTVRKGADKYFFKLTLIFTREQHTWHLNKYGLIGDHLHGYSFTARASSFYQSPSPSSLAEAWPPVPVGSGFACSQIELPFAHGPTSIRLSNLRVIAFPGREQLPNAKLFNGSGLRDEDGLAVNWIHCPRDTTGSFWLAHSALVLMAIGLLALVGVTFWTRRLRLLKQARTSDTAAHS